VNESTIDRLEALAPTEPTVAPLARLQAEALRAAADRARMRAVPAFERGPAGAGVPRFSAFLFAPLESGGRASHPA
jgi:hypothetical protein